MKRFILFLLCGLLVFNNTSFVSYATDTDIEEEEDDEDEGDGGNDSENKSSAGVDNSATKLLTEEQKTKVKSELGLSDDGLETLCTVYAAIQVTYNDYVAASICGNMFAESGCDPSLLEGGTKNGVGILQWSFGRRLLMSEYNKQNASTSVRKEKAAIKVSSGSADYLTTSEYVTDFGSLSSQVGFMMAELSGVEKVTITDAQITSSYYKTTGGCKITTQWMSYSTNKNSHYGYASVPDLDSFEDFVINTDVEAGAVNFCTKFERPKVATAHIDVRINKAKKVYELLKGIDLSGMLNKGSASAIADNMISKGYWSEEQLGAYCKLAEIDINSLLEDARRDNLKQEELRALKDWENNIGRNNNESVFVQKGRQAVAIASIIFMIWMLVIYLAFMFDSVNNFFDISLLAIVTFGRLRVSPDQEKSTYKEKETSSGTKVVNHKDILKIVVLGMALGGLIATGYIYKIIYEIVNFARGLWR